MLPGDAASTATMRLDLVGALLGDLEAERAALAVQQHHAGADLVDQREIGGDDRLVGESQRGTAWRM